ncbi:MAG: IS66 family insertion sequence element accessory protein TnpA [Planctomycetota bacterium]
MSRGTDPIKLKEWTDRLARFERSSQTVAEFCVDEHVSEGTFYLWKRRLASGDRTTTPQHRQRNGANNSAHEISAFQPVVVTPPENAASVRITLPGGAVIELSHDLATIEHVVRQLLQHPACGEVHGC